MYLLTLEKKNSKPPFSNRGDTLQTKRFILFLKSEIEQGGGTRDKPSMMLCNVKLEEFLLHKIKIAF